MGLFEKIFGSAPRVPKEEGYFRTLTAYAPTFTSYDGRIYEVALVRAAIDARARHISKLKIDVRGSARPKLQTALRHVPNQWQTWPQFLYRLSTILDAQNTAFIVPVYTDGKVTGLFPILPSRCTLVNMGNDIGIRYTFRNGQTALALLSETGILTKYQYTDDFFGEDNTAMNSTMQLIRIQEQGVEEAVKNSATYRFMATMTNWAKDDDIRKERKRFTEQNLKGDGGGLLLWPNTYKDVKQIQQSAYTVDAAELQQIKDNVYNYYGVNEKVLQNSANGDELDAYFNGAIEPFSIMLSEVLTKMLFSLRERSNGCEVIVSANRLQYMSTDKKISMAKELGDRGALLIDEIRDLFNLPPLPDGNGQHAPIRGEYYYAGEDVKPTGKEDDSDDGADDQEDA